MKRTNHTFQPSHVLSSITGDEPQYICGNGRYERSWTYSPYYLSVKDQGSTAMCCPYSIAYVVELAFRGDAGNVRCNDMDVYRLYGARSNKEVQGMSYKEAFEIILRDGVYVGPAHIFAKAYCRITNAQMLRQYIIAHGPALLTVPVYDPNRTEFWETEDTLKGYHGIAAIGFNDEGVEVLNSYGVEWGDRGRSVIPWAYYGQVREAWGLMI